MCVCVCVYVCVFECVRLGKCIGVEHTVLPDGQPPTAAFTVLAQLYGLKANESEINAAIFTNMAKGKTLSVDIFVQYINEYK